MISLVAALVSVIPMGRLLLEITYFKPLKHPVPPALPKPQGKGKLLFWSMFVIGALIACFTYIPMAELSQKLFVAASTRQQTWFFPQRMNNAVMLWAVLNGAMRFEGEPEWKSMLVGGFANSLGLMFIVVVQYLTFALTGTVYWTDGWLYVNLLFAVVPMMFVLPYFNRYFFRMTGRIYLGPMTTGLIFIMILISNTVIYLPL